MSAAALSVPLSVLLAATAPAAAPGPGTVEVLLVHPAAGDGAFADAVADALSDIQFTPMPLHDHGRYIAEVSVARESRGVVLSRVPAEHPSAQVGNWGGAVSVPIGTHKTRLQDLSVVTLTVRLTTRAEHRLVWSGAALTADVGRPGTASRLAHAALASFPVTSGTTATVP